MTAPTEAEPFVVVDAEAVISRHRLTGGIDCSCDAMPRDQFYAEHLAWELYAAGLLDYTRNPKEPR